jgi:hypothetical protein
MKKFDADMDGKLSQAELTRALEAIGEHHPRMAGRSLRSRSYVTLPATQIAAYLQNPSLMVHRL